MRRGVKEGLIWRGKGSTTLQGESACELRREIIVNPHYYFMTVRTLALPIPAPLQVCLRWGKRRAVRANGKIVGSGPRRACGGIHWLTGRLLPHGARLRPSFAIQFDGLVLLAARLYDAARCDFSCECAMQSRSLARSARLSADPAYFVPGATSHAAARTCWIAA